MLGISRFCRSTSLLPQIKNVMRPPSRNLINNGIIRSYATTIFKRPSLSNNVKIINFLRGSGTVAVRLTSDVSDKGKKAVGYWLLTCSGMVFVAVILGTVIVYYVTLVSICIVLDEIIKKTVR